MSYLTAILRMCWIGICALSMLALTRLRFEMDQTPGWLDGFVWAGMVFGYHFTSRLRWQRTLAWAIGLGGFYCYLRLNWQMEGMVLIPLLIWGAYYGWQKPGNAGWRSRPFLKPLAIAVAWAWVTVLLPLPPDDWLKAVFMFGARAGFVFALALAYDLHDRAYDLQHGLKTLAAQLDAYRTLRLGDLGMAVSGICAVLHCLLNPCFHIGTLAVLLSLGGSAWLIRWLFRQDWLEPWRKALIDALMPFQWLLALAMTWLSVHL
jgi:4-hydroxybenzoate polyprenyltransferase